MISLSDKIQEIASYSTCPSSIDSVDSVSNDDSFEFDDLTTVKTLYDGKFGVYLVHAQPSKRFYALKVFPWEGDHPSSYYQRESRFSKFRHSNIVSIPHFVNEHEAYYDDVATKVSYILMEYAQYGDMFNALVRYKIPFNETLVRTYFHQLIDALEFLHNNGAAHLDIKLENLLIAENYTLKVTDFDLSYCEEDGYVRTRGTKNFRAPELLIKNCQNPKAADVYSAGIMLFLLKTKGNLPYLEEKPEKGLDMAEIKNNDPTLFWKKHCQLLGKESSYFSPEFKHLFMSMTNFDSAQRMTIAEVKDSAWYKGPVYSSEELKKEMRTHFGF